MKHGPARRPPALLLLVLALVAAAPAPARAQLRIGPPRATPAQAESLGVAWRAHPGDEQRLLLYARALAVRNTIADRGRAVRALQAGLVLRPRSAELHIALADLYYRQGYLALARRELRRALAGSPDAAPAYVRLGRIAFRDWLKFQRPEALDVARHYWMESARRDSSDTEPWLGLGILALVAQDGIGAERYARACLAVAGRRGDPVGLFPQGARGATPERAVVPPDPRGEAWLLLGAGAYYQGKAALADSAFALALPLLRPSARALITDITPAAADSDTAAYGRLRDPRQRAEFLRRFWRARDPDLTTPLNELQLEFLARGALAYFLYYDQRRQTWDVRGALLVRYGPPEEVEYNPVIAEFTASAMNRLRWSYPSLGMKIDLEDRGLNESYDLPISLTQEVDLVPDPDSLAQAVARGGLEVAGRGLFHPAALASAPLAGRAVLAQFRRVRGFDPRRGEAPGSDVSRVEVYLATTGRTGPRGVRGEAAVFDSSWHEVARAAIPRALPCYSDTVQVTQVNFDLPAGAYTIGVAARDSSRGAAASWRLPLRVAPPAPGRLEVSDLELSCSYLGDLTGGSFDKLTYAVVPDPQHRLPRGQPLGVYFEIYGLERGDEGRGRLTVEYTVTSRARDRRPFFVKWVNPRRSEPRIEVVREDEVPGRVRYQFVSADLASTDPGPYRLDVRVADLRTGQEVTRSLDFDVAP